MINCVIFHRFGAAKLDFFSTCFKNQVKLLDISQNIGVGFLKIVVLLPR